MNISFLLIGGNEGNRRVQLAKACESIEGAGCRILRRSSLYETAPWGKTDQNDFLNQALQIQTSLDAPVLMDTLLEIEETMGRRRLEKYGSRIIDIDMLFFNEEIIHFPRLIIPHPEIQNRRFALVPMEEIAPEYRHPVLRQSIRELLAICPDKLEVRRLPDEPKGQ
ncbi:MAG TPA: 2-amino-4-hydroxy-6-hydroxymethyldihydropteridine diphosphokinase [Puia sp.]